MMSEKKSTLLSLVFIGLAVIAGTALFSGWSPVGASGDHDEAREMRAMGDIIPLAKLLEKAELQDVRILEVELERERGQVVYELELIDKEGKIYERYYNAVTGELLSVHEED